MHSHLIRAECLYLSQKFVRLTSDPVFKWKNNRQSYMYRNKNKEVFQIKEFGPSIKFELKCRSDFKHLDAIMFA